jgi:hypothetical protein
MGHELAGNASLPSGLCVVFHFWWAQQFCLCHPPKRLLSSIIADSRQSWENRRMVTGHWLLLSIDIIMKACTNISKEIYSDLYIAVCSNSGVSIM